MLGKDFKKLNEKLQKNKTIDNSEFQNQLKIYGLDLKIIIAQ